VCDQLATYNLHVGDPDGDALPLLGRLAALGGYVDGGGDHDGAALLLVVGHRVADLPELGWARLHHLTGHLHTLTHNNILIGKPITSSCLMVMCYL
jgi:hypothetical protein